MIIYAEIQPWIYWSTKDVAIPENIIKGESDYVYFVACTYGKRGFGGKIKKPIVDTASMAAVTLCT